MKKILIMVTTLMLVMVMATGCGGGGSEAEEEAKAPEVTREDVIGKWQESDNLFDGESNFDLEKELAESPDWVGYYVFNEDGTAYEWTGDEGVTNENIYTWELNGNVITITDDTFTDQTEDLIYQEDGTILEDHDRFVEGMEIVYTKM